jgi:hypothetical protein
VQLARDIVAQYEMLTAENIELFLDRDDLSWGIDWQARIDSALASIAFFIPVLTPRYFLSAACRSELNTFARRATALGVDALLLPILYVDFPGLMDESPADDLVALAKRFQWVDWRELRFADRQSPEYRREVAALAKRLMDANRAAETVDVLERVSDDASDDDEDAGPLEELAAMEASLPALNATMTSIGECIVEIGEAMQSTTGEINAQGGGNSSFAHRLVILRRLAERIAEPSRRIADLGVDFTNQLHDVDRGVRVMIKRAPEEPQNRADFCTFFASIRTMVAAAESGLGALQSMNDSAEVVENMSRDIRPPLRDMRRGLTLITEGRSIMSPWVEMIDATGIACE